MGRKMKVCMIVPDPAVRGGIASVVNGYRGSSLERDYEISYVESYRDGSKWQKLGKALAGYCAFIGELFRDRPDLVHVHSSFGPSFYRKIPFIYLSRMMGVPVLNHVHGAEFDVFYENASAAKKRRVARVYNRCTRLIVLSEEWKQRIARIVPAERIDVLENYCVIPEEPYDSGRKKDQVLFLGELGTRKGCYDIPFIWEQVLKAVPGAKLIMAGDGEMDQVRDAFHARGLLSGVVFPGWVRGDDKARLMRESGIFLFPTYHEGMPMAVLEAMSYGMGIVTTAVGGIPTLIMHGENGYIREPGDREAMAQDVVNLLTDRERCSVYGRRARADAGRRYGREQHLERLGRIYGTIGTRS